ncbi:hypothetical protein KHQ88_02085 [Mycoplasmatota bacterium]|nr:hypothetical protein KHQ88_02085 [Mycoplasmatota bacterium]
MKNLKIIKGLIIILLSITISVSTVYAWINFSVDLPSGNLSVGEIDFTTNGSFIDLSTTFYPGRELIDQAIIVTNESTIDNQIRVMISYTRVEDDIVYENYFYKGELSEHIVVNFNSNFVYGDDNYWYYPDKTSPLNLQTLPILDSLYYDGDLVSNQYANIPIHINIVIQMKQSDYVSWSELVSYNFVTGQPQY